MTDENEFRQQVEDLQGKMAPATVTNLYEQEAGSKVYEVGPGNFDKILKEFSGPQFSYGAVGMNIDRGDGSTQHMTPRCWGRKMFACPGCGKVREHTWIMCDEGWAIQCGAGCGVMLKPLSKKARNALKMLAAKRQAEVRL